MNGIVRNTLRLRPCLAFLIATAAWAETLPSADAPIFLEVIKTGHPTASLVLPDTPSETERIAADKLIEWFRAYAQTDLPVASPGKLGESPAGPLIVLGTADDQPWIAELVRNGTGGAADVPFLSDEGFGIETVEKGGAKILVIAGRTPKGVLHGAVYARDFLLDIVPPDQGVVVRETSLVRSPALAVRGPYLLPQYGVTPQYTLEQWKHIIDRMAEGGINQIHWWVAGMYPSKRYPATFEITTTKMSIDDIRELCKFAEARGMTFLVGGGGFAWHGITGLIKDRPELSPNAGMCPSLPGSRELMIGYAMDWLETFPEADGLWIEPRDEGGACKCKVCDRKLDAFNSRQYGQSEIDFLKGLLKKVWARNPRHKLVWLIEAHSGIPTNPHYDDPLYFERIREIKDPRVEWMVVWEQFKLPGPRNELTPVPFFTRNALHWDKPYWPNLQNVFAHARMAAEQGYLGYSNAWEIGFASNDWYINEVPYPVDVIPETLTSLGFREACWEPGQTFDDFTDRVRRCFFSREVPRSVAEDMLWLRQYITTANHTMEHASPMEFNEKKPLAAEVARVGGLVGSEERKAAVKRLAALLNVLKQTRDEALPRMARIEAQLVELERAASRKSKAGFALIRRAIADSRRVYEKAVPNNDVLDKAVADVAAMQTK
jgi:hypothetical protein